MKLGEVIEAALDKLVDWLEAIERAIIDFFEPPSPPDGMA